MARRRSRRRKNSYSEASDSAVEPQAATVDDLSPRARRLVESGVIDLEAITGSGPEGKITSGDILHAARVMEMEQSVPRIERTSQAVAASQEPKAEPDAEMAAVPGGLIDAVPVVDDAVAPDSGTSSAAQVGGEPISVAPDPWDEYNGSSDGLSEIVMPGAEQSWGEAEANIAAIAEEAAAQSTEASVAESIEPEAVAATEDADITSDAPELEAVTVPSQGKDETAGAEEMPADAEAVSAETDAGEEPEAEEKSIVDLVAAANEAIATTAPTEIPSEEAVASDDGVSPQESDAPEPYFEEAMAMSSQGEVMMDFGTLEPVDPDSVWAEGAENFAPWFLAHSQQLGDVLGLEAGLSDARQFTTKSATGVLGRDDNGDDVVVVSSKSSTADDSDLGRALGMAASSGAGSVALVSASLGEDQLKALSWLNNQTKSAVKWYGIEMRVVRIADSPAAMLFELVASPPQD